MNERVHWPHAPEHHLNVGGAFVVTAGTHGKDHLFKGAERLQILMAGMLKYAKKHDWRMQAWAVFPNHYHFVAISPPSGSGGLRTFLREFHSRSARWLNQLDGMPGRRVWNNYWETHLTYEASYYARLNYVHQNAVKHGLVPVANQYPWCSASWFEQQASPAFKKTIYAFKTDALDVQDDF